MVAGLRGWHKAPRPFLAIVFKKKIVRMLEFLLLNEGAIGKDKVELLGRTLINKFIMVIGRRGFFTGPTTFQAHFSLFARAWDGAVF